MIQLHYILINFYSSNKLYSLILKEIQNLSAILNSILYRFGIPAYTGEYQRHDSEIYTLYTTFRPQQKRLVVGVNLKRIEYLERCC